MRAATGTRPRGAGGPLGALGAGGPLGGAGARGLALPGGADYFALEALGRLVFAVALGVGVTEVRCPLVSLYLEPPIAFEMKLDILLPLAVTLYEPVILPISDLVSSSSTSSSVSNISGLPD